MGYQEMDWSRDMSVCIKKWTGPDVSRNGLVQRYVCVYQEMDWSRDMSVCIKKWTGPGVSRNGLVQMYQEMDWSRCIKKWTGPEICLCVSRNGLVQRYVCVYQEMDCVTCDMTFVYLCVACDRCLFTCMQLQINMFKL